MPSKKDIEDLGAPWTAMGSVAALDDYRLPPPRSDAERPKMGADNGDTPSLFSLGGTFKGSAGSLDRLRRIEPDVDMRLRYRKQF